MRGIGSSIALVVTLLLGAPSASAEVDVEDLTQRLRDLEEQTERPSDDEAGAERDTSRPSAATPVGMGWGALIGLSIVLVGLGAACRPWADRFRLTRRRQALLAKYRDEAIVEKILSRTLWEGETAEQLLDSLGTPVDVDHKASKTRRTEIWKYAPDGANRYRLRIQLDDDVVVGWEHR